MLDYYKFCISHQGTKVLSLEHNNQGALKCRRRIIHQFANCTFQLVNYPEMGPFKPESTGDSLSLQQLLFQFNAASMQCLLIDYLIVTRQGKSDPFTFHRKTRHQLSWAYQDQHWEKEFEGASVRITLMPTCVGCTTVYGALSHNPLGFGEGQVRGECRSLSQC